MTRRRAATQQNGRTLAGSETPADATAEDPDPSSTALAGRRTHRLVSRAKLQAEPRAKLQAEPRAKLRAEPRAEPRGVATDAPSTPVGSAAHAFRTRCFSQASAAEWNDWRWQLRNRIRNLAGLERTLRLSDEERAAVQRLGDRLPVGITPYYMALLDSLDPGDPLRRTMVPVLGEFENGPGEAADPLSEDAHMPVPGLVHRYPDRVLFLVTSFCATYCRYCSRSRLVGTSGEYHFNQEQYQGAIGYIAAHPEIRDVLISGGDPLTMQDARIEWLLQELHAIPHVEFVRMGTKIPAVLPQRITPELCSMLRRFHPLWLSVHFMHPSELTPEVAHACGMLADAGIPLGSQTVLLKGVNDDAATMRRLMHGLLKIRVRPYYIYQCDPIPGSAHFRTDVKTGLDIVASLRGHTTGYAVPNFVIDAPGGGGKVPIAPETIVGREDGYLLVRNFQGDVFRYPDSVGREQ